MYNQKANQSKLEIRQKSRSRYKVCMHLFTHANQQRMKPEAPLAAQALPEKNSPFCEGCGGSTIIVEKGQTRCLTPKISCDGRDANQLGDQGHLWDAVSSN